MRTFDVLRKTMSVILVVVFVSAQVAYPQAQNTLTTNNTQKLAPGVSAQQSATAQQNKESMVATMNTLTGSQNTPVSTTVNSPVLAHSGAHAMDALAPDPTTGILTLPNGQQVDLKPLVERYFTQAYVYQPVITYYDSGRVKSITTVVNANGIWDHYYLGDSFHGPIPPSVYHWEEFYRQSISYQFTDENKYTTTVGNMGRMTNQTITTGGHSCNDQKTTTYTYWNSTDTVKTKATITSNLVTDFHSADIVEYNASGAVTQSAHYTLATGGPAGSSGLWVTSKTLSKPDANGYVYYEYYNDGLSRDQWNNSIGRVKKAVKADGSYTIFAYYGTSNHVQAEGFYNNRGRLTDVLYYDENGKLTHRRGHHDRGFFEHFKT